MSRAEGRAPELHDPVEALRITALHQSGCVAIYDVRCRPTDFGRGPEELARAHQIVFPRRGVFVHEARGQTLVADPNRALFFNRDDTYRVAHPACSGDDCSVFTFEAALLSEAVSERDPERGEPDAKPFRFTHALTDDAVFLLHDRLRRAALEPRPGQLAIDEVAVQLLGALLGSVYRGRPFPAGVGAAGAERCARESTARLHREQVERTRLFLATHLGDDLSLDSIARAVHCSPYHLARLFRRESGLSIHQYRQRLRLREGLLRVAEGEQNLSALALELGFSSHSHFTDSFRNAFGVAPSACRGVLSSRRLGEMSRNLEVSRRARP